MKTRQIITVFILLTGFCLLREVERKVKNQSDVWIKAWSPTANTPTDSTEVKRSFAMLTTHQKLK